MKRYTRGGRHPFRSPSWTLLAREGPRRRPMPRLCGSSFEQSTLPAPAFVEWSHPPPFQPPRLSRARGRGFFVYDSPIPPLASLRSSRPMYHGWIYFMCAYTTTDNTLCGTLELGNYPVDTSIRDKEGRWGFTCSQVVITLTARAMGGIEHTLVDGGEEADHPT